MTRTLAIGLVLLAQLYSACAWTTYTVPHTAGKDDSPALNAAVKNYTANATILFQKGVTYNIFTPVVFPVFNNVEVRIEGNLTYPTDIPAIQGVSCCEFVEMFTSDGGPAAIVGSSVSFEA